MATFPGAVPSYTSPVSTNYLNSPAHATQHSANNDDTVAIATKVGIGATTPAANTVLYGTAAGVSAWTAQAKARAYQSGAAQAMSDGIWTVVTLGTTNYNIGSAFNTTTYQFTAPATGYYAVSAGVGYTAIVADCNYSVAIRRNGTDFRAVAVTTASYNDGAAGIGVSASDVVYLTSGDYIELLGRVGGTSASTTVGTFEYGSWLAVHLLSI